MTQDPTEAFEFEGAQVTCPRCPREGWTEAVLNRCAGCNTWFAVDIESGATRALDDPSEVFDDG